jgi:hypothetical protein
VDAVTETYAKLDKWAEWQGMSRLGAIRRLLERAFEARQVTLCRTRLVSFGSTFSYWPF